MDYSENHGREVWVPLALIKYLQRTIHVWFVVVAATRYNLLPFFRSPSQSLVMLLPWSITEGLSTRTSRIKSEGLYNSYITTHLYRVKKCFSLSQWNVEGKLKKSKQLEEFQNFFKK